MKWIEKLGALKKGATSTPIHNPDPKDNSDSILSFPEALSPSSPSSIAASGETDPPQFLGAELANFDSVSSRSSTAALTLRRSSSTERRSDPLGLTVLYSPQHPPTADILFLHGLGGTSFRTWTKDGDPNLFWPKEWLPLEPDIATARISTFGYNAHFSSTGPNSISNISDFARDLLFKMKFGEDGAMNDLEMGKVPIVFVAHSMGGLVFKKAYIQGHNNDDYRDAISQIQAVLFLSTPHRGTDLSKTLGRILSATVNLSPKRYVSELHRNSPTIEDLNDAFRGHANKLKIFSFYETLKTKIGPKSVMVLEKDSSTLGYPGEFCDPLNTDHHDICKYSSKDDPSYKSVRSVLRSLIASFRESNAKRLQKKVQEEMHRASALLSVHDAPEDDYTTLLHRWKRGTLEDLLSNPHFLHWEDDSLTESRILWLHARPGSGKSVMSSFLVNHMHDRGYNCSYYFFKFEDSTKQSSSSLLRSLAFQIAKQTPSFRKALADLTDDGLKIEKLGGRMIWEKIFVSILFKLEIKGPLYLIIDALDECDSINTVLGLLSTIYLSNVPFRILFTSRKTPEISSALDRIADIPVITISADDNVKDIRLYAEAEMEYMHGDAIFRKTIVDQIVQRAEGSFLWVHLAIKVIRECHRVEDIKGALDEMPPGMESLYQRMEASIARLSRPSDRAIAKTILAWATYSRKPLDADELLCALQPDITSIIDLRHTITQVCGNFVVADAKNRITLVHQTARGYLLEQSQLPFSFVAEEVQEELFIKTISTFLDFQVRAKLSQRPLPAFYYYAATSWAYHLNKCLPGSDSCLNLLVKFFEGPWVLAWIQAIAIVDHIDVIVRTSSILTTFVDKRRKIDAEKVPSQYRLADLELIELWAVDLLKLVGKFGGHLLQDPSAITKSIPQLCPRKSVLFRQFGKQSQITIRGLSNNNEWDDCLARVSVGSEHQALRMVCSSLYFAVLTSAGTIVLWNSLTFEPFRSFSHRQHVFRMCFSTNGELLASSGYLTTRVWKLSSGRLMFEVQNPPNSRALVLTFAENDTVLLMGSDLRQVGKLSLETPEKGWQFLNPSFLQEDTVIEGAFINSPKALAFSKDATHIAVAYRAFPLTVWSLKEQKRIQRCKRKAAHSFGNTWTGVNRVVWHPYSGDVLGIYNDGIVFKWNPFDETHQELQGGLFATPSEIECSPDGSVFATSDVNGAVKLYNHRHFSLIYQLSSEDIITKLCFSPDGRRFYDLRGSYCNVWEPNVLFRSFDVDERGSSAEAGSLETLHVASEAWAESSVPITALAVRPQGVLLCTGNDDGIVEMYDIADETRLEVGKSATGMSIDHLVWGDDGKHFAYAELGGRIAVKKVERLTKTGDKMGWLHHPVMTIRSSVEVGVVHQILLDPRTNVLLVAHSNQAQLFSLQTGLVSAKCETESVQKWANHPSDPMRVLAFTPTSVTVYSWETLEQMHVWKLDSISVASPSLGLPKDEERIDKSGLTESQTGVEFVHRIIVAQNNEYILLLISQQGSYRKYFSRLEIIDVATLRTAHLKPTLNLIEVPPEIVAMMERPLGVLGKDQLIFLDKSFWICTWHLRHTGEVNSGSLQKLFFLPRDWVSAEVLDLCQTMGDGTFLCPRRGEVAVIKSTLGSEW